MTDTILCAFIKSECVIFGWYEPCGDKDLIVLCVVPLSLPSDLKNRYKITAVPKLVIVKENGDVITDKGRKQIRDQGLACFRSWLEVAEVFQNFKAL